MPYRNRGASQTFGLKNKNKSKKVAKFVNQVQQQVLNADKQKKRTVEEEKNAQKVRPTRRCALLGLPRANSVVPSDGVRHRWRWQKKKEEDEAHKAELAQIIKPVQQIQKIAPGAHCAWRDPSPGGAQQSAHGCEAVARGPAGLA